MIRLEDIVKRLLGKSRWRWSPEKYRTVVEHVNDATFQEYQRREHELICQIEGLHKRAVVDFGCGYGRIFQHVGSYAGMVLGADIDNNMLKAAQQEAARLNTDYGREKIRVARHDVTREFPQDLAALVGESPVVVCLQNTLGTLKQRKAGDYVAAVRNMHRLASARRGNVVLSLLCQEALENYGVQLYEKIEPMIGKMDPTKCDFRHGWFASKTGYTSKWWTKSDRADLKYNLLWRGQGSVAEEINTGVYYILNVSYARPAGTTS